jgi:aminopeptidase N
MEHWGLVTFREVNLLYQEGVSSTGNKQRVATVIGHELAHMWFGNLGKLHDDQNTNMKFCKEFIALKRGH